MGFMKDVVLKVLGIGGKVLLLMTAGIVAERVVEHIPMFNKPKEEDQEEGAEEESTPEEKSVWSYNQQQ